MGAATIKSKRAQEIKNKMSKEDDEDLNEKILEFTSRIEQLIYGRAITAAPDMTYRIQL
jgi:hypothetical protein